MFKDNRGRPAHKEGKILQLDYKTGEIINEFESVSEAGEATGINKSSISKMVNKVGGRMVRLSEDNDDLKELREFRKLFKDKSRELAKNNKKLSTVSDTKTQAVMNTIIALENELEDIQKNIIDLESRIKESFFIKLDIGKIGDDEKEWIEALAQQSRMLTEMGTSEIFYYLYDKFLRPVADSSVNQ